MNPRYYLINLWRRKWAVTTTPALAVVTIGNHLFSLIYTITATLRAAASARALQTPTLYKYKNKLIPFTRCSHVKYELIQSAAGFPARYHGKLV
jgi:hypothetical protein